VPRNRFLTVVLEPWTAGALSLYSADKNTKE
jgi:hypothetical protein